MRGLGFTSGTDWAGAAQGYYGQAANTYAGMDKKKFPAPAPPKTAGGAMGAGLGMGLAGATAATKGFLGKTIQGAGKVAAGETVGSLAGPIGGAIGTGIGILGYFLG